MISSLQMKGPRCGRRVFFLLVVFMELQCAVILHIHLAGGMVLLDDVLIPELETTLRNECCFGRLCGKVTLLGICSPIHCVS